MEKSDHLRRGIAEKLSFGAELIGGVHRLVLTGQERLLLENHRGISFFSPETIDVFVKGGVLHILGGRLSLSFLTEDTLEIVGEIQTITFMEE